MTGEVFSLSSLLANNSSSFTLMFYELARDAFRVAKVWLYPSSEEVRTKPISPYAKLITFNKLNWALAN